MINFKQILMRNFLSFGNNDNIYEFRDGVTSLLGENRDNNNNANAVGKTTILQGVLFCLYGRIKKNTKPNLNSLVHVKNPKAQMLVSLTLDVDGKEYVITRSRHKTKSDLKLTIDGVDQSENSISLIDDMIVNTMGCNYDLFKMLFIFNDSDKFLDLSDKDMKTIIEEVLNLSFLSKVGEKLRNSRLELDRTIKTEERVVENERSNVKQIEESIEKVRTQVESFEVSKKEKLNTLSANLLSISSIDIDAEYSNIEKYNDYINNVKLYESEITQQEELIKSNQKTITVLSNSRDNLVKQVASLRSNHNNFVMNKTEKFDKLQTAIKTIETMNVDERIRILNHNTAIIDQIKNVEACLASTTINITNDEDNKKHVQDKLDALLQGVCHSCNQPFHDAALQSKYETQITLLNDSCATYNKQIVSYTVELCTLKEQINVSMDIRESLDDLKLLQYRLNESKKQLDELTSQENPYNLDDIIKIDADIKSVETSIKTAEDQQSQYITEKAKINNKILLLDIISKPIYNDTVLSAMQQQKDSINQEIASLLASTNPFSAAYELVKNQLTNNKLTEIEYNLQCMMHKRLHIHTLYTLFTDIESPLRKTILNQLLHQVNSQIDYYVKMLGLKHSCYLTEVLDVEVELDGNLYDYTLLSGGQQQSVNLAIILALNSVFNYTHNKINMLFGDEIDGGKLSESAQEHLVKVLYDVSNKHNMKFNIISHSPIVNAKVANQVKIVLENGFSEIIQHALYTPLKRESI